jgi:hypothetical protein
VPVSVHEEIAKARVALGEQLARRRKAAGYSTQSSFSQLVMAGRSTLANAEAGRLSQHRAFWERCDEVLHTNGALTVEYDRIRTMSKVGRVPGTPAALAAIAEPIAAVPGLVSVGVTTSFDTDPSQVTLHCPPGRFFLGTSIDAHVHAAVDDGRILASLPPAYAQDPFLTRPGRRLVLGRISGPRGHRLFGLDRLQAARRLRSGSPGARLSIPRAYRLDELTLAILWAVSNLDDALLADDALLEEHRQGIAGYEAMTASAVSRDLAADLTAPTRMWLGSAFCAGHILRHATSLTDVPVFWTREQCGEEAASWLLFTHKHDYLQATADRFPGAVRAFCIPRAAVDASARGERILLLLAVALMESYGINTAVTDEPEYANMPGFVHDRGSHAIVANWIGADGIWHVDVTDRRPALREYRDVADYTTTHSTIAAISPHGRLRALADYLDLDWAWLAARCHQLAEQGTAGVAQPRSRRLSVTGVDRACYYLAQAATPTN